MRKLHRLARSYILIGFVKDKSQKRAFILRDVSRYLPSSRRPIGEEGHS